MRVSLQIEQDVDAAVLKLWHFYQKDTFGRTWPGTITPGQLGSSAASILETSSTPYSRESLVRVAAYALLALQQLEDANRLKEKDNA